MLKKRKRVAVKKRKVGATKKGALVRGFLEKKERKGFEYLFGRYKNVVGNSSGIYALYKGKELYYVGIAKNLMRRVYQHLVDKHKNKWDKVSFFVIDNHKFSKDIETVILRIANPKGNGTKGKFEGHYELQNELNKVRKEMKGLAK